MDEPTLVMEGTMPSEKQGKKKEREHEDEFAGLPWREEDLTTDEDVEWNTHSVERSRRLREEAGKVPTRQHNAASD